MAALALAVALLLEQSGYGPQALGVIDNVLRHEAPPPRGAPPLVRELLARPLEAADAAAIWRRTVPSELAGFAEASAEEGAMPFEQLLDAYIEELAAAQADLLGATGGAPVDEAKLVAQLGEGLLSADALLQVAAAVDQEALERANARFVSATARFARALRGVRDLPREPMRFDSAIGVVVIGSAGNDRHGPAALIIDPGGDDVYERAPATGGAISVIVDLAGNDRYGGSDLVVRGLSALVDVSGDDRYELQGPGLGAAVAGTSLLVDLAGDDRYRVRYFGQGAAAFGIGALLDRGGDDRYEIDAWGQGYGLAGGLGLLWDASGNDRYSARGMPDPFDRGAGLSGAQGSAMGFRTMLPGGVGILRDDAGNDAYAAEMFAQGNGYFYGIGLLWDGGGDDRYHAVRYAQGSGVHEAVGVLRDESGADLYTLTFGVGQGMGLDLALGVLLDAAGDDRYGARVLAQGTGTANGIGLLADGGGADRWEIAEGERQWGHAEWLRGLPTLGFLVHDPARAAFRLGGRTLDAPPPPRRAAEAEPAAECPADAKLGVGEIEALRRDHLDAVIDLGERLHCALGVPEQAAELWPALARELERDPATPLGGATAIALGRHPPPEPLRREILRRLDAHPYCSVRALALKAAPRIEEARAALRSDCWRLQAAAVQVLGNLGAPLPAGSRLPAFLR